MELRRGWKTSEKEVEKNTFSTRFNNARRRSFNRRSGGTQR
jgi:hypothetical protein